MKTQDELIESTIRQCARNWNIPKNNFDDEPKLKNFKQHIIEWLTQYPSQNSFLYLKLLKNFMFYTQRQAKERYFSIIDEFKKDYPSWEEDTVFVKLEKTKSNESGADYLLTELNIRIPGIKNRILHKINDSIIEDESCKNIVIIDDFIGSGKSFETYMENKLLVNNKIFNKNIILIILHITEDGYNYIQQWSEDNSINIDIMYHKKTKKAFDNNDIFTNQQLKKFIKIYESDLNSFKVNNIYGFNNSQALLSFFRDTPNNTLASFAEILDNNTDHKALFPRHAQKRSFGSIIEFGKTEKQKRKTLFFSKDKDFSSRDIKENILIKACLKNKKNWSTQMLCEELGKTELQLFKELDFLIQKKLIRYENGRFYLIKQANLKDLDLNDESATINEEVIYVPENFGKKFQGYKS